MPQVPMPVSPSTLIRLGLRHSTAEIAAQEIAELAESMFGPFGPAEAEGWALSEAQDLGPATMRQILSDAAKADDPLAALSDHRDARAQLIRYVQPRWASPRGRALGHPPDLHGQTWASLSDAAREEVRDALQHLRGFWASRVRRNRTKRNDLDTFLSELAEIYVAHTGQKGDRRGRIARALRHWTDVPHSPTSRFVRLAIAVLAGLPPLATGEHRLALTEYTARGLSMRWERIKKRETES